MCSKQILRETVTCAFLSRAEDVKQRGKVGDIIVYLV